MSVTTWQATGNEARSMVTVLKVRRTSAWIWKGLFVTSLVHDAIYSSKVTDFHVISSWPLHEQTKRKETCRGWRLCDKPTWHYNVDEFFRWPRIQRYTVCIAKWSCIQSVWRFNKFLLMYQVLLVKYWDTRSCVPHLISSLWESCKLKFFPCYSHDLTCTSFLPSLSFRNCLQIDYTPTLHK